MSKHPEAHPQAGKTVKIKPEVKHNQYPHFGGSNFRIEDWWDRLSDKSWMDCTGNPACMIYAIRTGLSDTPVPTDDEVVYGHREDGLGSLVHVSELELNV